MTITRKLVTLSGVALTLIGLTTHAQAYQCKSQAEVISAGGFVQSVATQKAKTNWSNIVKGEHGLAWSVYEIAEDKDVECSKTGNRHECVVSAVPCLYVVQ